MSLLLAGCVAALAQDNHAQLLAAFNRELDPVRKGKLFPKLGDAHYALVQKEAGAGNYVQVEQLLKEYHAMAREAHQGLRAAVPDPEKHPAGFKQLQIHVRKTIRNLDYTITTIPVPLHPPLKFIRQELEKLDRELIRDLFPRQPGRRAENPKPKG